jgi:hypothetical protein
MRRIWTTALGLVSAMVVAGCQPASEKTYSDDTANLEIIAPAPAGFPAPAPAAPAEAAAAPPAPSGERPSVTPSPEAARIAYVYRYGLELPVAQVPTLVARHEQACVAAGPAVCQVVGSRSQRFGRDQLTAQLEIRATPAYVAAFRARLGGDAEAAGGRVAQQATDSEDLTRAMVDTEARVRALTTLRDRLQQLLATRSAPLEQLLATERELARVQGELDASRSTLEVMRTRVATSRLIVEYTALGQLAPDSAFRPVSDALSNALAVFMTGVAALILFFSGALPFLIVGFPLVWLILRWRRRVRAEQLAAKRAQAAEAEETGARV